MSQPVVPRGGAKVAIIGASDLLGRALAAEFAGQLEWNTLATWRRLDRCTAPPPMARPGHQRRKRPR